jgi:hypothetical protein
VTRSEKQRKRVGGPTLVERQRRRHDNGIPVM